MFVLWNTLITELYIELLFNGLYVNALYLFKNPEINCGMSRVYMFLEAIKSNGK